MIHLIEFYGSSIDRKGHVEKFIEQECPDEAVYEIDQKILLLENYAIDHCLQDMKTFEKVKGYPNRVNLYELKVKLHQVKYRLLFTINGNTLYFLDAFIKNNDKEMRRHFELAFDRAKNL